MAPTKKTMGGISRGSPAASSLEYLAAGVRIRVADDGPAVEVCRRPIHACPR